MRAEEEARDNIALGGRPDQGAQADETAYLKSLLDWHRMARDWSLIVSSGMVGLVLAVTVVGPFIVPADPNVVHSANRLLPPFWMEGQPHPSTRDRRRRQRPSGAHRRGLQDVAVHLRYGCTTCRRHRCNRRHPRRLCGKAGRYGANGLN